MTDNEIVFEEPPVNWGRSSRHRSILRELQPLIERPGEWARVRGPIDKTPASNFARCLRKGQAAGISPGDFEATARSLNGTYYVWARYVGYVRNGAD